MVDRAKGVKSRPGRGCDEWGSKRTHWFIYSTWEKAQRLARGFSPPCMYYVHGEYPIDNCWRRFTLIPKAYHSHRVYTTDNSFDATLATFSSIPVMMRQKYQRYSFYTIYCIFALSASLNQSERCNDAKIVLENHQCNYSARNGPHRHNQVMSKHSNSTSHMWYAGNSTYNHTQSSRA